MTGRWIGIATGTAIFAALAIAVPAGLTDSFDRTILLAVPRADWLQQGAIDITSLGSTTVAFLIIAIVSVILAVDGRTRDAWMLAACPLSGYGLMELLKIAFHRARPELIPHAVHVAGASFPSGHATLAALTYLSLASMTSPRARMAAWSMAILLIALVGVSRVYLGVHWPTDVIAGWCAGSTWAILWMFLFSPNPQTNARG